MGGAELPPLVIPHSPPRPHPLQAVGVGGGPGLLLCPLGCDSSAVSISCWELGHSVRAEEGRTAGTELLPHRRKPPVTGEVGTLGASVKVTHTLSKVSREEIRRREEKAINQYEEDMEVSPGWK